MSGRIDLIDGLGEVAERYGLFVIDQWGVLHDGHRAHPGAVEAMERLRDLAARAGARIAILSNSGKRIAESHERLDALGIGRELYDVVLTSGEQVNRGLKTRGAADAADPFYAGLGPRFLGFFWDEDRTILEGVDVEQTDDVETADFILCAGTDRGELDAYRPTLERALARGLPMTCANPDRVSIQPDGSLKMCPGAVAEAYERMGGSVRWHGKPQPTTYDELRRLAGVDASVPGLGIGDSLDHDIRGARDAGLDSLFIAGGIHVHDLPDPLTAEGVATLGARFGVRPTYAARDFRW